MSTALAENRFMLTKAVFTEGMRRVWADNSGKTIHRLLAVPGLLWLVFTGFTLHRGGGMAMPLMELFVLLLLVLWAELWLPRGRAQRAWRGMQETERVTRFFADHLEVCAADRRITLAYTEISRILYSKNLLILVAADKTGILLRRDSFTAGTEEEAVRLINDSQKENSQ